MPYCWWQLIHPARVTRRTCHGLGSGIIPGFYRAPPRTAGGHLGRIFGLYGITPAELDWRPAPGGRSVREVVHQLGDTETIAGIRLRRLLVEDTPRIEAYDEDEYARRLRHQERPLEPALQAFEAA
jgi:hypothetical protein